MLAKRLPSGENLKLKGSIAPIANGGVRIVSPVTVFTIDTPPIDPIATNSLFGEDAISAFPEEYQRSTSRRNSTVSSLIGIPEKGKGVSVGVRLGDGVGDGTGVSEGIGGVSEATGVVIERYVGDGSLGAEGLHAAISAIIAK
jgi:hypothetical protein